MTALPATIENVQSRVGMARVGVGLLLGTVAFIAPFSAGGAVLLPARLAALYPGEKIQLLAVLTGVSALVALISSVIFGLLSDSTRTRFGARTPWIVGGAVATLIFVIPLSFASDFASTLLWWCLTTAALNATGASVGTILADRVPVARRATISAVGGVALLLGTAIGTVVGSVFAAAPGTGFLVIGALSVLLALACVVVAPGNENLSQGLSRVPLGQIARSFRLPRHAPDFYWALWGRLALVLGYFMVNGFQLYIFTDYIHLSAAAAAAAVGLNSIIFLITALIGASVAGPLSDRLQRRKGFVIIATILAILGIAFPIFLPSALGMICFATVGGLAFGSYYAVDAALTSQVLPSSESRGRDLGYLNVANTGGQALAPAASAALVALGIGFLPVFLGAIVVCAVAVVCIPPIKSVR